MNYFYLLMAVFSVIAAAAVARPLWRKSRKAVIVMLIVGPPSIGYSLYFAFATAQHPVIIKVAYSSAKIASHDAMNFLGLAATIAVVLLLIFCAVFVLLTAWRWISEGGSTEGVMRFAKKSVKVLPFLVAYFFCAIYPIALLQTGLLQPNRKAMYGLESAYITTFLFAVLSSIGVFIRIKRGETPMFLRLYLFLLFVFGAWSPLFMHFHKVGTEGGISILGLLFIVFFLIPPCVYGLFAQLGLLGGRGGREH